jgi:hypothetical protein
MKTSKSVVLVCFFAVVGLGGMIAFSPHALIYDEHYHMEAARLLAAGSSLNEMLRSPLDSAAGPFYGVLHAALQPITKLEAPAVRFVNFFLLLAAVGGLGYCFKTWRFDSPWQRAAVLSGIPMVWVTTGIALTEVPGLALVTAGVAMVVWVLNRAGQRSAIAFAGFFVAGVFGGLAITARQTYLPIILAPFMIALVDKRWRWPALLAVLAASAIPLPMFVIWKGLTRSSQAHVGEGIAIDHGLLAFSYLAVVVCIIAPRFFMARWRIAAGAGVIGFLVNVVFVKFEWKAAAGLANHLPHFFLDRCYAILVGSVLVSSVIVFLIAIGANLWERRQDKLFVLAMIQTVVLTATAFGIVHLFSSRYVLNSFPFALVTVQPFFSLSNWSAARILAGAALGAASLSTYYW